MQNKQWRVGRAGDLPVSPVSDTKALRRRALSWLARREYSHTQMEAKLKKICDDAVLIDTMLSGLEREGFLSERRFAESILHRMLPRYGTRRIRRDLQQAGVGVDLVDELLALASEGELERAKGIWAKRFSATASYTPLDYARQMRFLQQRGFPANICATVLQEMRVRLVNAGNDLEDLSIIDEGE